MKIKFALLLFLTSCVMVPINKTHKLELGMNTHCGYGPVLAKVSEVGANWVRVDINWSAIEPKRDVWDFTSTDNIIKSANQSKLKVYACLISTPTWASESGRSTAVPDILDWILFVKNVSERYKDRISVYSIWNEPNLEEFWDGTATDYVEILLKPAYPIIKTISPNSLVAAPDLAHLYSAKLGISEFFKQMNSLGASEYFDILSHHLYGDKDFESKLFGFGFLGIQYKKGLIQILKESGLDNKEIWITELGSNSADNNEKFQNSTISKQLSVLSGIPKVKKVFIYHLMDDDTSKEKWGVYSSDGKPKLVYYGIKKFMGEQ